MLDFGHEITSGRGLFGDVVLAYMCRQFIADQDYGRSNGKL